MSKNSSLSEGEANYYSGVADELLRCHCIFDDDFRRAEHGNADGLSYTEQLDRIVTDYLAEPDTAGTQVDAFLESLPQLERIREQAGDPTKLRAFHALAILRRTREYLSQYLEEEQEIRESAAEHDERRGADADTSAANDPRFDDVADHRDVERSAREGMAADWKIAETSYEGEASEDEITESANSDRQPDRYSGMTPGMCFEGAKRDLFMGITGNARRRTKKLLSQFHEAGVTHAGELEKLVGGIVRAMRRMRYDDDGLQEEHGR